jgi:hypothetical protein
MLWTARTTGKCSIIDMFDCHELLANISYVMCNNNFITIYILDEPMNSLTYYEIIHPY